MKSQHRAHLVIVDPQMDLCVLDGMLAVKTGALFVPGADKDMARLANFVRRNSTAISDIHVTLDSHHLMDVSHPIFWRNPKGSHPSPFTIITHQDVQSGTWVPTVPSLYRRMLEYVRSLEEGKRYPLMIWPPHCLIGSTGHQVVPELMDALNMWAGERLATIDFVTKGSNPFTEHYSAIKAEIPDPRDPTTHHNTAFIQTIRDADVVLWAGEAANLGLASTIRDACADFDRAAMRKMVLLEDATSALPGMESSFAEFVADMERKGMRMTTTTSFSP